RPARDHQLRAGAEGLVLPSHWTARRCDRQRAVRGRDRRAPAQVLRLSRLARQAAGWARRASRASTAQQRQGLQECAPVHVEANPRAARHGEALIRISNLYEVTVMNNVISENVKSNKSKILIVGATGGTGRLIVDKAIARGYEVTA